MRVAPVLALDGDETTCKVAECIRLLARRVRLGKSPWRSNEKAPGP